MSAWGTALLGVFLLGSGLPQEEEVRANRIEVAIDPRVELMSIIFRLAGNPEYNMAPAWRYVRNVEEQFRPHADHAAVQAAQRLRQRRGVSYDAVMSMALHVEDAFGLEPRVALELPPERLDGRWRPEEAEAFLEVARDFAEDTGFADFLESQAELYRQVERRLSDKLSERDYLEWFDEFFGARGEARFCAVPGLLTGGGNYGCSVELEDGSEELFCVLGVWQIGRRGVPVFGDAIVPTVVHEFCHSYVNPIVDAHEAELRPAGVRIFPHVAQEMSRQAYGSWQTMMRESFVRACVARYVIAADGDAAGQREVATQHARSFHWTGELVDLLEIYEINRDGYETFDDFMPETVEFFEEYSSRDLAAELLPELGPINNAFRFAAADKMLMVTPDQPSAELERYLAETHARFFKGKGVALRTAASVSAEERKKALVLYGSPTSNSLLKDIADRCGFEIAADHLTLGGKRFDGADLVLITCFPNPFRPEVPVLLYTSADDRHVIRLNHFFHGPTDYVIGHWDEAGKPEVVAQGSYDKSGERWILAD